MPSNSHAVFWREAALGAPFRPTAASGDVKGVQGGCPLRLTLCEGQI